MKREYCGITDLILLNWSDWKRVCMGKDVGKIEMIHNYEQLSRCIGCVSLCLQQNTLSVEALQKSIY